MCPACITTAALIVAGASSTGGLAALVAKMLRGKTDAENTDPKPKPRESEPCSTTAS